MTTQLYMMTLLHHVLHFINQCFEKKYEHIDKIVNLSLKGKGAPFVSLVTMTIDYLSFFNQLVWNLKLIKIVLYLRH